MTVIEKRRVVMQNPGTDEIPPHGCVDFVPLEILDAYVEDARTRWAFVDVGTTHDPGPAGDDGPTVIPPNLIGETPNG